MNNDLQYLYNTQKTINGYISDNGHNAWCERNIAETKKKTATAIKNKRAEIYEKMQKRSDLVAFRDGGVFIILFLVAFVAAVVIGTFTFLKPIVSYSVEDYIAECAEEVRSGSGIAKLYWGDEFDELLEEESGNGWLDGIFGGSTGEKKLLETNRDFVGKCATFLFGNLIFTFIFCALIGFIFLALTEKNGNGYGSAIGIPLTVFLIAGAVTILFFFFPAFRNIVGYIHVMNTTLGGILQIVLGIPLIFVTSGKMMLPIILIQTSVYLSAWLYTVVLKKNREGLIAEKSDSVIAKLISERTAFEKAKNAESEKSVAYFNSQKRRNRYAEAYAKIPAHLSDLSHVNSLIWAINNGYARDIVSAKNYLDRKAHEAQVMNRLSEIKREAEASRVASERAAEEAAAARAAVEAPVEVYYYYI